MSAPLRLIHVLTVDEVNKALREIQDAIVPPALPAVSALGIGELTLTTDYQAIPGLAVVVPRSGSWLVLLSVNVFVDAGDGAVQATVSWGPGPSFAPDCVQTSVSSSSAKSWIARLAQGQSVVGKALKLSGGGASLASVSVGPGNQGSRLDLVWLSP